MPTYSVFLLLQVDAETSEDAKRIAQRAIDTAVKGLSKADADAIKLFTYKYRAVEAEKP